MATCYRHPSRETGVSCSNCGKPICPDCMTPTPVGMRCPDCASQKTKTRTMRSMNVEPTVTYVLIGICVLFWIGTVLAGGGENGKAYVDLELIGGAQTFTGDWIGVSQGEYWRLVTGGFLHAANPLHILFNMYILYWIGRMLEPMLGHARFLALYFTSLLAGSFGALLFSPANQGTVGASGAVFGLMAAAFVMQHARGINPWQSGIGPIILLNLALGFIIPNVSIGGHIGGLVGGALVALAFERLPAVRRSSAAMLGSCALIAVVAVVGAIAVADAKTDALQSQSLQGLISLFT
jgi:membrane associated rhomboid family serine protease